MEIRMNINKYFKNTENAIKVKKILDKETTDADLQKFIFYELISSADDFKINLKTKKYLFHHDIFNSVYDEIKEEDDFLNNPIKIEDGVIECSRCKSLKTFSYSKQTRASDEGTSVFVTCSQCHFKFRL